MFNNNAPQTFVPEYHRDREYAGWYIFTEPAENLWDTTNARAMCAKLNESHGDNAAAVVLSTYGVICVGNPGIDWEDFALVESLLSIWENGGHINERLWNEALDEGVADRWNEMETSERAGLCLDCTGRIAGAFMATPPDAVWDYLAEGLAQG